MAGRLTCAANVEGLEMAADGSEGPLRTADQDELRAAEALLHLVWSVVLSHNTQGARNEETRIITNRRLYWE